MHQSRRPDGQSNWKGLVAGVVLLASVAAGCSIGRHSSSPTTAASPSTTAPATSTSTPGPQTSGSRTVMSPVGLNVRAAPTSSARVLGAAAQGVALTVLGYTSSDGGWYKVKGATVTGWITAKPTLSAPGQFQSYSSAQFTALYPSTWTEPTPAAPSSVVFHPASGSGDIVVTTGSSVSKLPHGRAGYSLKSVSQVVVCGITAGLVVFQQSGTPPTTGSATSATSTTSVPQSLTYLAEARFAVDKKHALGFYADLPDLGATFQTFEDVLESVTFSAPQCSG